MTDTMSCERCGADVPANAAFCTSCGARVEGSGGSEQDAPPVADAPPADDATRIETVGLHDATRVFPASPAGEAAGSEATPWASPAPPASEPQPWSPPAPAGQPPPPAWQPPPTAAPPPGAWPPAPPQPDWAQQAPPGGSGWAAPPVPPSAPPSQWQQPAPSPRPASGGAGLAPAFLALLGAVLLVICVFTSWVEIKGPNVSTKFTGWELATKKDKVGPFETPDPAILLGIAAASVAVAGVLIVGKFTAAMRGLLVLAGIGVAVVVVRDYLSIKDTLKKVLSADFELTFQFGFWLGVAAAVVLLVAAVAPSRRRT